MRDTRLERIVQFRELRSGSFYYWRRDPKDRRRIIGRTLVGVLVKQAPEALLNPIGGIEAVQSLLGVGRSRDRKLEADMFGVIARLATAAIGVRQDFVAPFKATMAEYRAADAARKRYYRKRVALHRQAAKETAAALKEAQARGSKGLLHFVAECRKRGIRPADCLLETALVDSRLP
jgi:hypothetical protein